MLCDRMVCAGLLGGRSPWRERTESLSDCFVFSAAPGPRPMLPGWLRRQHERMILASILCFLLSALVASASITPAPEPQNSTDLWAHFATAERQALRWRRTKYELERFQNDCAWLAPAWRKIHAAHESLERVIVLDVRHRTWPGVGDSQQRLWSQLRFGRSLGRCARRRRGLSASPCINALVVRLSLLCSSVAQSMTRPRSPAEPPLCGSITALTATARRTTRSKATHPAKAAISTSAPTFTPSAPLSGSGPLCRGRRSSVSTGPERPRRWSWRTGVKSGGGRLTTDFSSA